MFCYIQNTFQVILIKYRTKVEKMLKSFSLKTTLIILSGFIVFAFFLCVYIFSSVVEMYGSTLSRLQAHLFSCTLAIKQAPNSLLVVHIKSLFFLSSTFLYAICVHFIVFEKTRSSFASFLIKHTLAVANDCDENNYGILLRT